MSTLRTLYLSTGGLLVASLSTLLGAEESAVYGGINATFVTVGNAHPAFATSGNINGREIIGDADKIDYGYTIAPEIFVGWRRPNGDTAELDVWFLSADEDGSSSVDAAGDLADILVHPNYADGANANATANADSEVKAMSISLLYGIPVVSSDWSNLGFLGGLRYAKYDSELSAVYQPHDTRAELSDEGTGIGLQVGFRAGLSFFDKRLRASLSTGYSLLRASVESSHMSGDATTLSDVYNDVMVEEDTVASILEVRIALDITIWRDLSGTLGYQLAQWDGFAKGLRPVDDFSEDQYTEEDPTVSFDGFIVGLNYSHAF